MAQIAGEPYGEGGCEIPDGYVEPAPEVYDALAHYAELGTRELGPLARSAASRDYFGGLATVARMLAKISRIELDGQPLPVEAQRFLGMVSEIGPYGSDGRPTYTGCTSICSSIATTRSGGPTWSPTTPRRRAAPAMSVSSCRCSRSSRSTPAVARGR